MNTKSNKMKCPHCGEPIDVNEVLYHQLEEKVKNDHNRQFASKRAELQEEKKAFEKQKLEYKANLEQAVEQGIQEKTANLKESLNEEVREEYAGRVKTLEEEVEKKSGQVKDLHKSKAKIKQLEREKDALKDEIESEAQERITETVNQESKDKAIRRRKGETENNGGRIQNF